MEERVYVDSSDLMAYYRFDMSYDGVIKVYSKNRPVEQVTFDSESSQYPNEEVFKIISGWGLIDEYVDPFEWDNDIGCDDFTEILIENNEVVELQAMGWMKSDCTCNCGETIVHKRSPIPPGYGKVFNQD